MGLKVRFGETSCGIGGDPSREEIEPIAQPATHTAAIRLEPREQEVESHPLGFMYRIPGELQDSLGDDSILAGHIPA